MYIVYICMYLICDTLNKLYLLTFKARYTGNRRQGSFAKSSCGNDSLFLTAAIAQVVERPLRVR